MDILMNPWPWYMAGPCLALVMVLLLYFGGRFGASSNLRTICAAAGAGKYTGFFRFDWKAQRWNLVFLLGAIIGGWFTSEFLMNDRTIDLNQNTVMALQDMGFKSVGEEYVPAEIYGNNALVSPRGIFLLVLGGFLVGFGARYAGGCTSGHAISGLSNLQIPSLLAVVGFFVGGLLMTHFILPFIFPILINPI